MRYFLDHLNKQLSQQDVPSVKNFWLRFLKYFTISFLISYGLYWIMAQMDLTTLKSLHNKRSALFSLMLSIMSAKSWGWFWFIAMISSTLWGDWQNFRWQSFPKEESQMKRENGSDSNSEN